MFLLCRFGWHPLWRVRYFGAFPDGSTAFVRVCAHCGTETDHRLFNFPMAHTWKPSDPERWEL